MSAGSTAAVSAVTEPRDVEPRDVEPRVVFGRVVVSEKIVVSGRVGGWKVIR
jgi:hypothetical protein